MKIGTKSVLFGYHAFWLHPFFVAEGWRRLYGFPFDPKLWAAFLLHDIGYLGKPNMDGKEGEAHPEMGAGMVGDRPRRAWSALPTSARIVPPLEVAMDSLDEARERAHLSATVDTLQREQWYDLGRRHGHTDHCRSWARGDCPVYSEYRTDHRDRKALIKDLLPQPPYRAAPSADQHHPSGSDIYRLRRRRWTPTRVRRGHQGGM